MSVQKTLKFKGVKKIWFDERLREKEGELKEFWKKLFGGYRLPSCPNCQEDMRVESVKLEERITVLTFLGKRWSRKRDPEPEIEASFTCPKCNSKIYGWGRGLKVDLADNSFSLEEFSVTNWKKKTK